MKKFLYTFITLFFVGCTSNKYIIMPNIKGKIYSRINNKPLDNVSFFVSKYAINALSDTVKTDNSGAFFSMALLLIIILI